MKKLIVLIILILFAAGIILVTLEIQEKNKMKNVFNDKLAITPQIELYDMDNKPVRLDKLCSNKKTIIICFDTDCDICRIEAKDFLRLRDKFEDSHVVFISNNTIDEIKKFIADNELEKSGYLFLNDKNYLLIKEYHIPTIPFMLLYIDSKLYKTYKGGINIEQIIRDKSDK